ncbi:MAG TPA: DUF4105 domain-containing protein [Burkholderiaceae bacterium]|nr:DUF4105 domain-containing protein [Burkholderiaceae bacterium]
MSARQRKKNREGQAIILIIQTLVAALVALWGGLALWVQQPGGRLCAKGLIVLWVLAALAFMAVPWLASPTSVKLAGRLIFPALVALVLVWWAGIRPSNDKNWIPEVSRPLQGTVDGDVVILENVRNFLWRSADDCTPRWETRHYDLNTLRSVDLSLSYWAGPAVAHVMVSFGFGDGGYVAFSVEIRRKVGDKFSEIGGFFRQYELSIVAADERDILRVRTNVRGEDGYMYRVHMPLAAARSLFLAYVDRANRLVARPRFYNTVTANCTTLVYQMMDRIVPGLPMSYQLLASGYLPEYLYRLDALAGASDLAEYRRRGRYTDRALANTDLDRFSHDIRRGVPGIDAA